MAWSGSTANGVGTYVSATCIKSNPNMTFDGTKLGVTGNICASTCLCSPIVLGTTCVSGAITCGTTCVQTALLCSTGQVKGTILTGSTCVISPIICATTCFIGSGAGLTGTAASLSIGGSAGCANVLVDAFANPPRIGFPAGGARISSNIAETGAIKIKLPTAMHNSSSMILFTVKIYQYSTGQDYEIMIGGYNAASGNWYQVSAILTTDSGPNLFIRFGDDGASDVVWIGELGTVWNYPQVYVTDAYIGYSGPSINWATGWAISYVTSFDSVEIDYGNASRQWNSKDFSSVSSCSVASSVACRDASCNFAMNCLTAVDVIAGSDRRIKKCIEPIVCALSTVMRLQGVSYIRCNDETNESQIGLIAQDTLKILPAVVSCGVPNTGDFKYGICDIKYGIKYDKITAVLIEAVKEQQKIIEKQGIEIACIKAKLNN